jgi:hypothetical protein
VLPDAVSSTQPRMAFKVSSVPLLRTLVSGRRPCWRTMSFSSRAICSPEIDERQDGWLPRSHRPLASARRRTVRSFSQYWRWVLVIDRMTFAPQRHVQTAVAEPPILVRQGFWPLAQLLIIRLPGLLAHAGQRSIVEYGVCFSRSFSSSGALGRLVPDTSVNLDRFIRPSFLRAIPGGIRAARSGYAQYCPRSRLRCGGDPGVPPNSEYSSGAIDGLIRPRFEQH